MTIALPWMPPNAPYMPVATLGLLSVLDANGTPARAFWDGEGLPLLTIETTLELDDIAIAISDAERPAPERVTWPKGSYGQSMKKTLEETGDPAGTLREMLTTAAPAERRMLRAIVTDAVLDGNGVPTRSRLLRGVKSDLSTAAAKPREIDAANLEAELRDGPRFVGTESGLGLGLVPEVQTFGGTTGRDASSIGAYSPLLYLLLWHGLLALPPIAVRRGPRRTVGGPLVTAPDSISWPRWKFPASSTVLRSCFAWAAIHEEVPDLRQLRPRGVDSVYRAHTVQLSTMVSVFRWGEQVARG